MKYFQTLVLFFSLAFALPAALHAAPPAATINLGRVPLGAVRDTLYTLSVGAEPLVVSDVRINCNCVKARWDKRPVAPGGHAEIRFTFHAKDLGVFYKTVEILTSDPSRNHQITIKGTVF